MDELLMVETNDDGSRTMTVRVPRPHTYSRTLSDSAVADAHADVRAGRGTLYMDDDAHEASLIARMKK